jgi:hypothetical protein
MAALSEDEVYLGSKALLRQSGWELIAGQPPDGCDSLPVVEIKMPGRQGIGSGGAYKPDLIVSDGEKILLVECKPRHSPSDVEKLRSIVRDAGRISLLYKELAQRRLLERRGFSILEEEFHRNVFCALAHSGEPEQVPDFYVILVRDRFGQGEIIPPYSR